MAAGNPPGESPAGIAWLDLSIDERRAWPERVRIGPLGLQIEPLDVARAAFYFKGARLRGARCLWAAASLNGALLTRSAREQADASAVVELLVRGDSGASVFEAGAVVARPVLKVVDPRAAVQEQFHTNSHLCTLRVHASTVGVEPASLAELVGRAFPMSAFQVQLTRSMVPLLLVEPDAVRRPSTAVGVDRLLGAFAGLLLRSVTKDVGGPDPGSGIRIRTEAIIDERVTDPLLTPATIAGELRISLRQLYRAFDDEAPAALIRRRRLERAMQLLVDPHAPVTLEAVAAACGFASPEYFSRAFRREFGLSPRAYRSAHRDMAARR